MRVHAPRPPTSSSFLLFGQPRHIFHASFVENLNERNYLRLLPSLFLISPLISAIFAPAVITLALLFALFLRFCALLNFRTFFSFLESYIFIISYIYIIYFLELYILDILTKIWETAVCQLSTEYDCPICDRSVPLVWKCLLSPRLTNNRFILLIKRPSCSVIRVTDLFENEKSFFYVFDKWCTYATCLTPRIWRKIDIYYLRNHLVISIHADNLRYLLLFDDVKSVPLTWRLYKKKKYRVASMY